MSVAEYRDLQRAHLDLVLSHNENALAAATALLDYEADAETLARKAMAIAAEICVYTNGNLTVETLESAN